MNDGRRPRLTCISPLKGAYAAFVIKLPAIQAGGFKSPQEGQTVQFDVTKGPKGWQAENVTAV